MPASRAAPPAEAPAPRLQSINLLLAGLPPVVRPMHLRRAFGLSAAALARLRLLPGFPPGVTFNAKTTRWTRGEIRDWLIRHTANPETNRRGNAKGGRHVPA
jgi:hypothetical protein